MVVWFHKRFCPPLLCKWGFIGFLVVVWSHVVSAQVTFMAVGDVMMDRGIRTMMKQKGVDAPFEHITPWIQQGDIAMFNLETAVVDSGDGHPLLKRFSFRADPSFLKGLTHAGFNLAHLANNHTIDYGKEGLMTTIRHLKANGIHHMGAGENEQEAFRPSLLRVKGQTFAFFGMLEFLLEGTTFLPEKPYPAYGSIDQLCRLIEQYRDYVDYVVVSFHWGKEFQHQPTRQQEQFAHRVIDAGADLVLGHHAHVLQPMALYKNKWIVYGLGNFVFDQSGITTSSSAIFTCDFKDGQVLHPRLIPVYIEKGIPRPATPIERSQILQQMNEISAPYQLSFVQENSCLIPTSAPPVIIQRISIQDMEFQLHQNSITAYHPIHGEAKLVIKGDYTFKMGVAGATGKRIYIYALLQKGQDSGSVLVIYPFSIPSYTFLQPSMDRQQGWNPEKLLLMDVDSDGDIELLLLVHKKSRYDTTRQKRIFVFHTNGDHIYPKWLGSKMGNPVIDMYVSPHDTSLWVLEQSYQKSQYQVVSYRWNGFGFDARSLHRRFEDVHQPPDYWYIPLEWEQLDHIETIK
jgi:gamma-polyglutamate biosynthesis protein CapA